MKRISLLLVMQLTSLVYIVHAQDFVFVKYELPDGGNIDHEKLFDPDPPKGLVEFQRKYSMKQIEVNTNEVGAARLQSDCDNLSKLGLFIDRSKITGDIVMKWGGKDLKVDLKDDKSPGIIFLDLTYVVVEKTKRLPEKPNWFSYEDDKKAERTRICQIASLDDGIEFKIGEKFTFKIKNAIATATSEFRNIEPRQYVTIYEKKNPLTAEKGLINTANEVERIWWLEKTSNNSVVSADNLNSGVPGLFPRQLYTVVSNKSTLEIRFDNEALARNIDFHGSVSLVARSGEKKIEVSPYSVIGEGQKQFGVNAMPIKEIADYFLRLMIESKRFNYEVGQTVMAGADIKQFAEGKQVFVDNQKRELAGVLDVAVKGLQLALDKHNAGPDSDPVCCFPIDDQLVVALKKLALFFPTDGQLAILINQMTLTEVRSPSPFTFKALKEYLEKLKNIDGKTNTRVVQTIGESTINSVNETTLRAKYLTTLVKANNDAKLCFELMKRIKSSNDQTINAFLSVTTLTITDFNDMYARAEKIYNNRANVEITETTANSTMSALLEYQEIFTRFTGSSVLFNDLMKEIGININSNDLNIEDLNKVLSTKKTYDDLRNKFAIAAGKEIFKKMVYATIDLSKANLPDGSKLDIGVVWYNAEGNIEEENNNEKGNKGTELWTASFIVKKTGWHLEVSESALLIHRIDEEKLRSGYPLSPSNFKPTAGANLLWSYFNPYRAGGRIKQRGVYKGQYKEYSFLKFLHWIEPSFGINVSYLDFRTDRDFEFGAGPVMGLFQNRIFLTTGYNFSVNGESPFYMGIGFSFSNIYKRINKADNE